MIFKNGVKNIQAAAYNGAHTVCNKFHLNFLIVTNTVDGTKPIG